MKRMRWILAAVLVLGLLPLRAGAATLAEAGKSAVLMDVTTGTVLYENNSHEPLAPADRMHRDFAGVLCGNPQSSAWRGQAARQWEFSLP